MSYGMLGNGSGKRTVCWMAQIFAKFGISSIEFGLKDAKSVTWQMEFPQCYGMFI